MKRALCFIVLGLGLLPLNGCGSDDDGGTGDPVSACKELMKVTCSKFFGCLSKEEQMAAAAIIGNNEADCNTKFSANCTTEMTKCDSGETYSSSAASECLSQFKALSCAEFTGDNTSQPAACDQVCK